MPLSTAGGIPSRSIEVESTNELLRQLIALYRCIVEYVAVLTCLMPLK